MGINYLYLNNRRFMKTKFFTTLLLALLFSNAITASSFNQNDPEKDKVIIYVLQNILTRGHYVQKDMDDVFSEHVFHNSTYCHNLAIV